MTTPNGLHGSRRAQGLRAGFTNIKASVTNAADAGRVLTKLAPKQLKDEIQIAKFEVKEKGIALGKGAAVAAVAAVFALLMAIALTILAYVGLSALMPNWAAALVLVVLFLILAAITGLVGFKMIKAQLPFKPESAIFGVLYDLGVLKEGSAMTSKRLKREQAEKAEAKKAEKAAEQKDGGEQQEPAVPPANKEQLLQRTKQRREHLKTLRDDLDAYTREVQAGAQGLVTNAKNSVKNAPATAADGSKQLAANASNPETLQARWKSFAALLASLGAFVIFLGKLITRRK
ncbi:phage holin family protein [Rothia nasisuis]|uniref:phage holin family protein n=1 Tax=Rothia nasisuis TaxID=2109647 RepID=UPI001F3CFA85|nr:phage holin family protein [Rothia nasisuis]